MSVDGIVSYKCFIKNEINFHTAKTTASSSDLKVDLKEITSQVKTRKELSLKEKLDILKQYDKLPKMSQRNAAVQLNISQPVLCKIIKNRNFIENIMQTNKNSVRKRTRGGKEREVETALKLWYVEVQKQNIPLNGQIIREKAKELAKQMGKDFAATEGWFTRWRKRENIVYNSFFSRKLKPDREFNCFKNSTKTDRSTWINSRELENSQVFSNTNGCVFFKASLEQKPTTLLNQHSHVKINSTTKVPETICKVFIKTELTRDAEFGSIKNYSKRVPTNEEMLEALRILSTGVKYRTSNLQLHSEYENFIYGLLKKEV